MSLWQHTLGGNCNGSGVGRMTLSMKALRLLVCFGLILCVGCLAQATRPTTRPGGVDHGALDRILRLNVRDQRVDYLIIRKRHWRQLNDYLETLAKADLQKGSREERLATLINLYNASMIRAVIQRLHADYSPSEDDFVVFKEKLVRTRHGAVSLNHLEHDVIRKQFKEPRVHVALVCGAASCPPLIPRAYVAKDLDDTLQENMRAFVSDEQRNRMDTRHRKLQLSQIFHWYAQDFGGKSRLRDYVQRYSKQDLNGFEVSFLEYSWKLNLARPAGGRWIRTRDGNTPLYATRDGRRSETVEKTVRQGSVFEVVREEGEFIQVDDPLGGGRPWVMRRAVTSAW